MPGTAAVGAHSEWSECTSRVVSTTAAPCHRGPMTSNEGGQVSEVSGMDPADADTEISDSQGVAGNPDAPDSEDLKGVGPNANPHADEKTH